ncbi:unnamed protein product [Brassica rapa subsp. trilocularis]
MEKGDRVMLPCFPYSDLKILITLALKILLSVYDEYVHSLMICLLL